MAMQPTEQGSHTPTIAAAVDPDRLRPPPPATHSSPTGGMDCPELSAVAGLGLPEDPIAEIISRLPAKPLFRFKCVSKTWFRLITDWLRKFPPTLQGFFYGENDGNNHRHFVDLLGGSVPPVDPSLSFLPQLPEIEKFVILCSCNGLLLLRHMQYCLNAGRSKTLGYIVCNPATKEWVTVPRSGSTPARDQAGYEYDPEDRPTVTCLIFDPAVSSQFKLVQFCLRRCPDFNTSQVHTYSSESECWSIEGSSIDLGVSSMDSAFVNGMLHLRVCRYSENLRAIVAVDGEGETSRIIHWAQQERGLLMFLGQSQGNLICVSVPIVDHQLSIKELSIWVLEDYGTEQWIMKDRVSSLLLFGEANPCRSWVTSTIAVHPDRNVVFFVYRLKGKLVSYDMDSKEVSTLGTLEHSRSSFTPYFPYFSESSVLAKKQ